MKIIKDNYQTINNRSGKYAAIAFVISNSLLNAKNIIITGSPALYSINSKLNFTVATLSFLIYFWAIIVKESSLRFSRMQIAVILLIFSFWGISFLYNSNLFSYSYVREELIEFLIYSFPAIIILPLLGNCNILLDFFYKSRWYLFVLICLSVLMIIINGQIQGVGSRFEVYSMSFGKSLMFYNIIFFSKWFKDHDLRDLIASIIITFFILIFASRFPLLCIGFYLGWKFFESRKSKNNLLLFLLCLIVCIFLIIFHNQIVNFLYNIVLGFGINSRSLALLLDGNFRYDSGRTEIHRNLIEEINKSPIIGYGAGGGNIALNNGLSHSFVLDVFANLGYLFGGVFLLLSVLVLLKVYRQGSSKNDREFIIICISLFIPISYIQTSMWRASFFWIIVALSIGLKKRI